VSGPAIVLWWGEDGERRQVELLELVPGPPTAQGTWPRQVVHSATEQGGWAIANLPRLGPLAGELIERLAEPGALGAAGPLSALALDRAGGVVATGGGGLHADCLRATCRLIAARLRQPIVRSQPYSSGLLLARLRDGVLELAPAVVRDGAVLTGVPVMSVEAGGAASEPHALQPGAGEVDVALAALEPVTGVPSVTLELGAAGEAQLELLMPDLNYEALEDRWPAVAPGTRRSYLVVR
jgi:hypothetical protein